MSRVVKRSTNPKPQRPSNPQAAFDFDHGPEYVVDGSYTIYPDGAWRENVPYGAMAEPSNDMVQRYEKIVRFHRIKLQEATEAFSNVKRQTQHPMSSVSVDEVQRLKACQQTVFERRDQLHIAEAQLRTHKLEPRVRQWLAEVHKHEIAYREVKHLFEQHTINLPQDGPESIDMAELDILQNQLTEHESRLRVAVVNLDRAGGDVPEHLDWILDEQRKMQFAEQDAQRLRRKEVNKIEV